MRLFSPTLAWLVSVLLSVTTGAMVQLTPDNWQPVVLESGKVP